MAGPDGFLGWHDAGFVDRFEHEAIATGFFHVIIPLWPRPHSEYQFTTREGSLACFPIRRDRRSVVLGYLRTPTWLAVTILAAGGISNFARWYLLAIAFPLAVLAAILTFALGRLDHAERERRASLQRVTGIAAPPELLPHAMRTSTRDDLADAWFIEHGRTWRDAIERGTASEILVVLADYAQAPSLVRLARRNLIDDEGN